MSNTFSAINGFQPDWEEVWSIEEAEQELTYIHAADTTPTPFVFRGPGWYIREDDVMLVMPHAVPDGLDPFWTNELAQAPFRQMWPAGTKFRFSVYNNRNPGYLFGLIANAPTREHP